MVIAIVQTEDTGFNFNGESDLDLQYAMALVGKSQPVNLYQVGDVVMGASFNNLLDALDGSFCTFEGGDDPEQDGIYPDPLNEPGAFKGMTCINTVGCAGRIDHPSGPQDCGTVKPANVISTSYGYNEADLTPFYTARQCAEYAKVSAVFFTLHFFR